ncbi:short-chain dehydrogenase [Caulobacter sp. CCUG 60055]|nr:SDR family oxidoreductase [Caulobacter sp. CCUG 60055]MBQ1543916.1 SDR family NAD(P)-dependent oxidoreductase [Caulobacteraceae bacterium]MCI3180623.1 short-chain dehydrogenase [Caulobacter sp. CCUG 60055]
MKLKLKPLNEQVVVITGATSGIGLSTARAAAQRGARLLLVARNAEALKAVCDDLTAKGAKADYCVADVGDQSQVRAVVQTALDRFGGFDAWVNNAGVSIFGHITDTPVEDQRRLMETNYWGVVYGSLAAVEHFKTRDGGGALINIGSVLGDLAVPLKGPYCASKHAVRAFTNALRLEMIEQKAPVSVTLIKPSAVDTPYKDHARNLTGAPVRNPPPVYATPLVAQAVLYAAEHRTREITIGAGGRLVAALAGLAPFAADPLLAWFTPMLNRDKAGRRRVVGDNLHQPGGDLRERSFYKDVRETSLYTAAQMRPKAVLALAVLAGAAAGLAFALGRRRGPAPAVAKARAQPDASPARAVRARA